MQHDPAAVCAQLIRGARVTGALTGAGISTNAGIPDFRGPQGLYITRRYDPETVFDIGYFSRDPGPFFAFARDFLKQQGEFVPTPAHRFLARLESAGLLKGIITQNIDCLHQQAGSQNVLEMHGSFWTAHCLGCRVSLTYPQMREKILSGAIPRCACGGLIKPDIVFFGEQVKCLGESAALAESCDVFLVIGTSCAVYPAAAIPSLVQGKVIVINRGPADLPGSRAVLKVEEDIDDFLTRVEISLFEGQGRQDASS